MTTIKRYQDGDELHDIILGDNGKYQCRYSLTPDRRGGGHPASTAGPFDTLAAAINTMRRTRPAALEKRRWYFKRGTVYEEFSVLYDDGKFNLVRNDSSGHYSFGTADCFNTLYGYPVNWSSLTASEAVRILNNLVKIDTDFLPSLGEISQGNIDRWNRMAAAVLAFEGRG